MPCQRKISARPAHFNINSARQSKAFCENIPCCRGMATKALLHDLFIHKLDVLAVSISCDTAKHVSYTNMMIRSDIYIHSDT